MGRKFPCNPVILTDKITLIRAAQNLKLLIPTNFVSQLAPDGCTLITTCEGLCVCARENLPENDALSPCFSVIGSGNRAFSLRDELFLQSVENALLKLTDCLERGSFPTLTTDRQGNLRVKVVLADSDGLASDHAIQQIQQMLSGLARKHGLIFSSRSPDSVPTADASGDDRRWR